MVKVKEKQWEFTVKPLLHGISDLEVFVWLRPKTAYVLPYTSSIFANLTYDTRRP